jgi:hypothetical protein
MDELGGSTHGRRTLTVTGAAAAVLVIAGGAAFWAAGRDGDSVAEPGTGPSTANSGPVAATPRALAVVALRHLDVELSGGADSDLTSFPQGAIAADLRFNADGEYDGDLLRVAVSSGRSPDIACGGPSHCASLPTDGDASLTMQWCVLQPEDDPGVVVLTLDGDEGWSQVLLAGPDITGDPRSLDLPISVDEMAAVINDPAFGLTTTQEMVDAGAALTPWE